jgi:hypothetical protein
MAAKAKEAEKLRRRGEAAAGAADRRREIGDNRRRDDAVADVNAEIKGHRLLS